LRSPKQDLRRALREHGEASTEKILKLFDELLETEKTWHPLCPRCGVRSPHALPDWSSRVRALELLMAQGWGRPAVQATPPAMPADVTNLEALTDEQLREMVGVSVPAPEPEPEESTAILDEALSRLDE
jgi:hypothetical protein